MIPGLFFANPWGFLALGALPVIVGIHCLQEKSRRVRASTLFLLERAAPLPSGGIRLETFRNSLPFWMQLLAAAALAWLLADPRWIRSDSRQTVAVVLDSSASMQAGRAATLALLARRLADWDAVAARTDWHLLETGPGRPPLYAGRQLADLLAVADRDWQPVLGSHDVSGALGLATNLVPGAAGAVILVTDRPVDVPGGVALLSAGAPFDNVGFSGGDVGPRGDELGWRVLVTNHGAAPQSRDVRVRIFGTGTTGAGPSQPIQLAAGQSRTLEGRWPDAAERIVISLSSDRFAWDDTLPLVRPLRRTVKVAIGIGGPVGALLARIVRAADGTELVGDVAAADLVIGRFDPGATTDSIQIAVGDLPDIDTDADPASADDGKPSAAAGKTAPAAAAAPTFDPAWVAAEDHPLTRDLGWGGLMSGPAGNLGLTAADEPLLWKGGKPLAFVRASVLPGGRVVRSLVLNFDLAGSTAARSPALVVLVQRFIDRIRTRIPRPWADNFETGQVIDVPDAVPEGSPDRTTIDWVGLDGAVAAPVPFRGRAPETPGFFALTAVRGTPPAANRVAAGAAQFADSRECDFRAAAPLDTLEAVRMEQAIKQSIEDPWAPVWLGIAIGALLVAWGWRAAGQRAVPPLAYTRGNS
jgi:hypothetical protein